MQSSKTARPVLEHKVNLGMTRLQISFKLPVKIGGQSAAFASEAGMKHSSH